MNKSQPYLTDSALAWLNSLLRDRISENLSLTRSSCEFYELRSLCNNKKICFSDLDSGFLGLGKVDDCVYWNSAEFGWRTPSNLPLPAPRSRGRTSSIRCVSDSNGLILNYDLPGLIYWQLTRIEEQTAIHLDAHGRFPATASHAFAFSYLERPFIDEWLYVLRQMAQSIWPSLVIVRHYFHLQPSHDVDFPSRYSHCSFNHFARSLGIDIIRSRSPLSALLGLRIRWRAGRSKDLSVFDPYNTFDWIMSQSEKYGLRSYFYFICGGAHQLDPGYDPRHPAIRQLMRIIHERGHYIGLHPSYICIDRPDQLFREWDMLRTIAAEEGIHQDTWGVRMHYLRTRYPGLWGYLERCGVDHDASMGYADRVGFRAGTAHPYPAFDHSHQCAYKLKVIPLVVMEGTLYASSYMGLNDTRARERKIYQLRSACESVCGQFSVLWHNSELMQSESRATYLSSIQSQ